MVQDWKVGILEMVNKVSEPLDRYFLSQSSFHFQCLNLHVEVIMSWVVCVKYKFLNAIGPSIEQYILEENNIISFQA